jgi:hypothetical protein
MGLATLVIALVMQDALFQLSGIISGLMIMASSIPMAAIWLAPRGWPRQGMLVISGVVIAMACYAWLFWLILSLQILNPIGPALVEGHRIATTYFIYALIGSQLVANLLRGMEVRR